jgi:hypothetical protein
MSEEILRRTPKDHFESLEVQGALGKMIMTEYFAEDRTDFRIDMSDRQTMPGRPPADLEGQSQNDVLMTGNYF